MEENVRLRFFLNTMYVLTRTVTAFLYRSSHYCVC